MDGLSVSFYLIRITFFWSRVLKIRAERVGTRQDSRARSVNLMSRLDSCKLQQRTEVVNHAFAVSINP